MSDDELDDIEWEEEELDGDTAAVPLDSTKQSPERALKDSVISFFPEENWAGDQLGKSALFDENLKSEKRKLRIVYMREDYELAYKRHRKDIRKRVVAAVRYTIATEAHSLAKALGAILPADLLQLKAVSPKTKYHLLGVSDWLRSTFTLIKNSAMTSEEGRDGSDALTLVSHVVKNKAGSAHQLSQILIATMKLLGFDVRYLCTLDPTPFTPSAHEDIYHKCAIAAAAEAARKDAAVARSKENARMRRRKLSRIIDSVQAGNAGDSLSTHQENGHQQQSLHHPSNTGNLGKFRAPKLLPSFCWAEVLLPDDSVEACEGREETVEDTCCDDERGERGEGETETGSEVAVLINKAATSTALESSSMHRSQSEREIQQQRTFSNRRRWMAFDGVQNIFDRPREIWAGFFGGSLRSAHDGGDVSISASGSISVNSYGGGSRRRAGTAEPVYVLAVESLIDHARLTEQRALKDMKQATKAINDSSSVGGGGSGSSGGSSSSGSRSSNSDGSRAEPVVVDVTARYKIGHTYITKRDAQIKSKIDSWLRSFLTGLHFFSDTLQDLYQDEITSDLLSASASAAPPERQFDLSDIEKMKKKKVGRPDEAKYLDAVSTKEYSTNSSSTSSTSSTSSSGGGSGSGRAVVNRDRKEPSEDLKSDGTNYRNSLAATERAVGGGVILLDGGSDDSDGDGDGGDIECISNPGVENRKGKRGRENTKGENVKDVTNGKVAGSWVIREHERDDEIEADVLELLGIDAFIPQLTATADPSPHPSPAPLSAPCVTIRSAVINVESESEVEFASSSSSSSSSSAAASSAFTVTLADPDNASGRSTGKTGTGVVIRPNGCEDLIGDADSGGGQAFGSVDGTRGGTSSSQKRKRPQQDSDHAYRFPSNGIKESSASESRISSGCDMGVAENDLASIRRAEAAELDRSEKESLLALPTRIADFKGHPVFVLERHLLKDECVRPDALVAHDCFARISSSDGSSVDLRDGSNSGDTGQSGGRSLLAMGDPSMPDANSASAAGGEALAETARSEVSEVSRRPDTSKAVVARLRGEAVYLRRDVEKLRTRLQWRRAMRSVRSECIDLPVRVQTRTLSRKRQESSSSGIGGGRGSGRMSGTTGALSQCERETVELKMYGSWQTEPLTIAPVVDRELPVNEYGNIEVWDGLAQYVPQGAAYVAEHPEALKAAKNLSLPFAPAVVGFEARSSSDGGGGGYIPVVRGVVVLREHEQLVRDAAYTICAWADEKQMAKQQETIRRKWAKIVAALLSRNRLRETYGH